jgi:hypothetical protein
VSPGPDSGAQQLRYAMTTPPQSARVYESLDALHFDESAADGTAVEATETVRAHSDFAPPITILSCAAQASWINKNQNDFRQLARISTGKRRCVMPIAVCASPLFVSLL